MSSDEDYNDSLDEIWSSEDRELRQSYEEGYTAGTASGNPDGYHLGYHRGAELGRELGYYQGVITHHLNLNETLETKYTEKVLNQLVKVKTLIDSFPRDNSEEHDILGMAETIRAQYKKACALLKISSVNPFSTPTLSTVRNLKRQLDSTLKYLTPLLPLANCHMVEFITGNHWEKLLPTKLRDELDRIDLNDAVHKFWMYSEGKCEDTSELCNWIVTAKSHYIKVNNDYCLSKEQLKERIQTWGGEVEQEIKVTEFMNSKKSYEVQTMSPLVAALHTLTEASCCVEAGGGRGHLPAALSLGYRLPTLTVDCDRSKIDTAEQRIRIIQKQWHAIAKQIKNGIEERISTSIDKDLHRFAAAFITEDTDLAAVVRNKFPEHSDTRLLLTGLHTCGDLGPDCLRIFKKPTTVCVFNVPCCYHLLTEPTGFPMSEHLKGYKLGRNARMLAAQSIDRVVHEKQCPAKSLLYRAMLEHIIHTHLPNHQITEGKLKRLSSKSQNFQQYFEAADAILNLQIFDTFTDSCHMKINEELNCQWRKLVLFYFMRLCLAQVIESIILLDRILFLFENGFNKVYLVKLFDPVLSPRCHSIVALK